MVVTSHKEAVLVRDRSGDYGEPVGGALEGSTTACIATRNCC